MSRVPLSRRLFKLMVAVVSLVVLSVTVTNYFYSSGNFLNDVTSSIRTQGHNLKAMMNKKREQLVNVCDYRFQESSNNNVLIVGATSDAGLFLAKYFKQKSFNVFAIEYYPPYCETGLSNWYELLRMGIKTEIVLEPSQWIFNGCMYDKIVYSVYHEKRTSKQLSSINQVKQFKSFVNLLSIVAASTNSRPELYLISGIKTQLNSRSISSVWLNLYENMLNYYHEAYNLSSVILRIPRRATPLSDNPARCPCYDCTIANKSQILTLIDSKIEGRPHKVDLGLHCELTSSSIKLPKKNIVMSTYFTNIRNPQYHTITFRSSSFRFIQKWFQSAMKYNSTLVIFHDGMDSEFQRRMKDFYKHVDLIKVSSDEFKHRTPNDYRFYLFHDYLVSNPAVGKAMVTDIRDVDFMSDPFSVIDHVGNDYLYVGLDIPFYTSSSEYGTTSRVITFCHFHESGSNLFSHWPNYNAGVLAGSRGMMISYLHAIVKDLDDTPPGWNCNMASMMHVTMRYFQDNTYSGYPFQCPFKCDINGPQGCAVRHKYT